MTAHQHPSALPKGHRIGEYEIRRVLGAGGFGITYQAFDHRLDGPVAPKEYFPVEVATRVAGLRVAAASPMRVRRAEGKRTTKMRIDPLRIKTAERLAGVRALLNLLEKALPEHEERERTELRKIVQKQGFDCDEYDVERQILDSRFGFWLPRFAAYSIVVLLYAVLEVQLFECARRARRQMESPFGPEDIKGGIENAAAWLTKSGASDVKQDEAWSTLTHLRDIRNLIAHRAGTRGDIKKHQETVDRLLKTYRGHVKVEKTPLDWWSEVWISMDLCRRFTEQVEAFLGRVLSDLDVRLGSEASKPRKE